MGGARDDTLFSNYFLLRLGCCQSQEGWNASQRQEGTDNGAFIRSMWFADPAEERGSIHMVWIGTHQPSASPGLQVFRKGCSQQLMLECVYQPSGNQMRQM